MTSAGFESFVGKLLEDARRNPERLEKYRRKLNRRSRSLLGAVVRVIGGPGAEDIMVEPKAQYLANLFSSSGTHEMKKYTSSLNLADLRELMDHCEQRGTSGILFTSTNRVARSVWSRIRSVRSAEGIWKYVVIDRDLILELLIELQLTSLLTP
jgi:ABC-type Fe3+-citrate transport system substrate-binding protein